MKALLVGKDSKNIEELVKSLGCEIVSSNPDVVISYGGDGTLLTSEREYPEMPKLPIRNSQFCNKCPEHEDKKVLEDLLDGKLILKEYKKLHTNLEGKDFYALNDFVIRNKHSIHAIRFKINNNFFIGDGIVVSTPFGSTGYFKSITNESFDKGFALAFNNTTKKTNPIYLSEEDNVKFELVRGNAILTFDNNLQTFNISERKTLIFDLSDKVAKIYISSLRCPNCQIIRG